LTASRRETVIRFDMNHSLGTYISKTAAHLGEPRDECCFFRRGSTVR
jgi:hypothetical protein